MGQKQINTNIFKLFGILNKKTISNEDTKNIHNIIVDELKRTKIIKKEKDVWEEPKAKSKP